MKTSFFRRARNYQPWTTERELDCRTLDAVTTRKFGKVFDDLDPSLIDYAADAFRNELDIQRANRGHVDESAKSVWIDLGQIIDDAARYYRYNSQTIHENERSRLSNIHGPGFVENFSPVPSPQFHVSHHSGNGRIDVTPHEVRYQGKATDDLQAVYAGMVHAKAQQWEAVEVGEDSGHDFKLKTWCSARKQGLEVTNFKPGITDLLRVRSIMKELDHHLGQQAEAAPQFTTGQSSGPTRPKNTGPGVSAQPEPA